MAGAQAKAKAAKVGHEGRRKAILAIMCSRHLVISGDEGKLKVGPAVHGSVIFPAFPGQAEGVAEAPQSVPPRQHWGAKERQTRGVVRGQTDQGIREIDSICARVNSRLPSRSLKRERFLGSFDSQRVMTPSRS